jgi:hypothetical protein
MYNTAMRMCAVDTFRHLAVGTYYDFLSPDLRFIHDNQMLSQLYDNFVHHYLYERWAVEIRNPGGLKNTIERNNASQARIHVCVLVSLVDVVLITL